MGSTKFFGRGDTDARRAFSVSALGRGRWYWVVWPSLAQIGKGQASDPILEGFASNKLEAIDQALAVAAANPHWLAASYSRQYYQSRAKGQTMGTVTVQEFVYYDMRVVLAGGQKQWRSAPYLIMKRTPKFVYVAAAPYQADPPVTHWADASAERIRLDRASLERWGYAFVSFGDADRYGLEEPLFYTVPNGARGGDESARQECFVQLELTPPYSVAAVKHAYRRLAKQHHPDRGGAAARFLALQVAYRQALDALDG